MLELVAEYIDRIDTAAEDRLLTTKLVPYEVTAQNGTAGCLVGVASGAFAETKDGICLGDSRWWPGIMGISQGLFAEFNSACESDPVATAEFIRNRILENRAGKELAGIKEAVGRSPRGRPTEGAATPNFRNQKTEG